MSNEKNLLIKPLQPSQKHIQVKKKKKLNFLNIHYNFFFFIILKY